MVGTHTVPPLTISAIVSPSTPMPASTRSRPAGTAPFTPEGADSRHARAECPPGVLGCEHSGDTRGPARLAQRPRAWRAVPEIRHVGVQIDQAGGERVAAQVDHLGACRRRAGADRRDAIVV